MATEIAGADDALSRTKQKASPLYAGRVEIYAKAVQGHYRKIKWAALIILLGIYYILPWIRWTRGPGQPDQAVLVDMAGRRLYFFWIEIWPQEVYYLTGVLILSAFGLFLATALFGRIWCGFACPQTVWTDLYMQVERWIEGDRAQRIRFDKAPWTAEKWRKRILKHVVWLLIALFTGGAWIMYFNVAPTVVRQFFTGQAGGTVYFFTGLFTFTTYLLAGMAREQVCTYMCPWPRIQGALVDKDTMAVTYEAWRGEPRDKYRKGESFDGRGDCIDCNQCVAACPTGVDIREGFQLECIGCGLCIDACDDIMDKIGRPKRLIAYDSERNQELRAEGKPSSYRIVRPRTILYAAVWLLVALVILVSLSLRSTLDVDILPERNPMFVTMSDGSIRNSYLLKIMNKTNSDQSYRVAVEGLPAQISTLSTPDPTENVTLVASPDGVTTFRILVRAPRNSLQGDQTPIKLGLTDTVTGSTASFGTIFRGPGK
ncbi:MAG: cytochrome c oxidase accessory protein CcoG [Geminicoccaceae bacterium]